MFKTRKQKKYLRYALISLLILIFINGFVDFKPNNKINLIIKGSTSVEPFIKAVKNEYKDKYNITLSAQGSGTGITSLFDQKSEIAMSSRDLKPEELVTAKQKQIEFHEIAKDGISIIVNKDLKMDNLTKDQLKKIYSGEITNWNQLGLKENLPINVVARDEASGTREGFDKLIGLKAIISNAKQIEATGEVIRVVEENKGAIAYVSSGAQIATLKALKVDNIAPSDENIKNAKYELYRKFYLLNYKNNQKAADFVAFTKTKAVQELLKSKIYKTDFISIIK